MSHISNRDFLKALATALLALVISAAVLIPAYLALFPTLHPEFADSRERSAKPVTLSGAQFRPVVFGDGGIEGNSAVISQLAEGKPADQAVLLHQRRFSAADYPFLRHHIEGWHPGLRVMLFWRRADDPQTNHYSELDYTGEGAGYFNLLRSEEWRGQIIELAVGFFGELRGEPVKLHEVRLEPYGVGRVLEAVGGEWTRLGVWDQTSINVYRGVPKGALIYPVPAVAAWVGLAAAIVFLMQLVTGNSRQGWGGAFSVVLIGWFLLDGLWLRQLFFQNVETRYLFAGKSLHEKKLADWDGEYYAAALEVKTHLNANADNAMILYLDGQSPLAQRLRFHLLPETKATLIRPDTPKRALQANSLFDHVILISAPGTYVESCAELKDATPTEYKTNWRLIWCSGPVALYATNRGKD